MHSKNMFIHLIAVSLVTLNAGCWEIRLAQYNQSNNEIQQSEIKLLFPGTKWCGSGSSAEGQELGYLAETDGCCRDHDMCPDVIESMDTKHNLTNHAPYTRLHCDCDDRFYKCLKQITKESSFPSTVGLIYFDILGTKCYRLAYPVVECIKYSPLDGRCEDYAYDTNTPKQWQWFDVPKYLV